MKENMRSRRGVTLVEVVIALVVIGIISVATLTVIFSSVQIENKTVVAMDVRNQAENAIECFRFAKGDREIFIACLNRTTVGDEPDFVEAQDNSLVYVLDKGGYKTTITVTVEMQADNTEIMTSFDFVAMYENDGKEIHRFEFPAPKPSNEGGITE